MKHTKGGVISTALCVWNTLLEQMHTQIFLNLLLSAAEDIVGLVTPHRQQIGGPPTSTDIYQRFLLEDNNSLTRQKL
jgi:hypothetical protein